MKYVLILLIGLTLSGCSSNDELPGIDTDARALCRYTHYDRHPQRHCAKLLKLLARLEFRRLSDDEPPQHATSISVYAVVV